jgi:hypothetical protein
MKRWGRNIVKSALQLNISSLPESGSTFPFKPPASMAGESAATVGTPVATAASGDGS